MSILIALIVIVNVVTLIACCAKDIRINELELARKETQDLADRTKRELVNVNQYQKFCEVLLRQRTRALGKIIVALWGEPQLDRNADDVCGYIKELQRYAVSAQQQGERLVEAYQSLSERTRSLQATLDARTNNLTAAETSLRELQKEYLQLQRTVNEDAVLEETRAQHGLNS